MTPIQLNLGEDLLREMDARLKGQKRARSEFIREAVRRHLAALRIKDLEELDRRAYLNKPVRRGEFDGFYKRQQWGRE